MLYCIQYNKYCTVPMQYACMVGKSTSEYWDFFNAVYSLNHQTWIALWNASRLSVQTLLYFYFNVRGLVLNRESITSCKNELLVNILYVWVPVLCNVHGCRLPRSKRRQWTVWELFYCYQRSKRKVFSATIMFWWVVASVTYTNLVRSDSGSWFLGRD
jgi:hypothetical protein